MLRKILIAIGAVLLSTTIASAECIGTPGANRICASPSGGSGPINPRLLVGGDLPQPGTLSAPTSFGSGDKLYVFESGTLKVIDYDDLPSGGGGGAPADATYYVTSSNGTLSNEVVVPAFIQGLLDDTDAPTARSTLGVIIGTNVQAYDADLTTYAGITPSANVQSILGAADYAAIAALQESANEAAIDTLANLTSIQGLTVNLTDDGFDVLAGWDDSDSAYESLSLAELTDEATPATGDYLLIYGAEGDVRKTNWSNLPGAGGGISNVVEDTTPQLGGALDTNGFGIELGTANTDTTLTRASAGVAAVEGSNILTAATGQPLDADLTTLATAFSTGNATQAAFLDFAEDTDNGSNRVRLSGAQSTADVTVTLPAATDTLVGKATTDTLTNKTIDANGTGNSITNIDLTADVINDLPFTNITQITTDRLLGRDTAATGDIEELTVGGGIEFTGSGGIQRSALTGDVTASAGSNSTSIAADAVGIDELDLIDGDTPSNGDCLTYDTGAGGTIEAITCPGGGITDVVQDTTPQLGGDLDANLFDILFDDNTGIQDESGNEQLTFQTTASAVNQLEITNAATGGAPSIGAAGDDANISISLIPKGTGQILGPAGAAGTPAFSFAGDSNTGITNETADAVTIVNGGSYRWRFTGLDLVPVNDGASDVGSASAGLDDIFGTTGTVIDFSSDTSLTRSTAGNLTVEGNLIYRAGGTDVPIADGGTGASTAASAFSALKQDATTTATGVVELATTAEAETGTDTTRAITAAGLTAAVVGKETIAAPAGSWTGETTTGCATGTAELGNGIMQSSYDCDGATQEGIQFFIPRMAKSWDESTITAQISWTNASGTGDVIWLVSCAAISNDDVMNASFGTEVSVTDSVTAAADLMQTSETGAVTCSGTPAEGDALVIRIQRDGDAAGDTLNSVDARFLGANIYYTTNATTDD